MFVPLSLSSLALAGSLTLSAAEPVLFVVDGTTLAVPAGFSSVTLEVSKSGRHQVEARSPAGAPLTSVSVEVRLDQDTWMRYANRSFVQESVPLRGLAPAASTPPSTVAAPTPAAPTGPAPSSPAFPPGTASPLIAPVPASATPPPTTPAVAASPLIAPVPSAPRATAPVEVVFLSQDGEWANVWVDGEQVAEFRVNTGKVSVTLLPGTHTVEVRDFMNGEVWAKGTLTVGTVTPLKVGFGKKTTPVVYNDASAWK